MSVSVSASGHGRHTGGACPDLVIEPSASGWRNLIRFEPTDTQQTLRRELGLPADQPVLMSGHQATLWGPGILAKWIACVEGARALGAHAAWLVADLDSGDASEVRYPARDEHGAPRPGLARLEPGRDAGERAKPTANQAPIHVDGHVPDAVHDIADALRAHEGETDAARQAHGALADLASPIVTAPSSVFARELSGTTLFAGLVERMRDEPDACARAYNDAVSRYPESGVRPLVVTDDSRGVELPLWVLTPLGGRRRATADDLHNTVVTSLAPRALLLTAIVRLGACELFIHGTGGGKYDKVTEDWVESWLGRRLAPAAVVTATVLPDVAGVDLGAGEAGDRAAWRAHAARHNPAILGDDEAGASKRDLLARIDAARDAGGDPGPHYRRLHEMLAAYRTRHAAEIENLADEAARLQGIAAGTRRGAQIARDRTLAFPFVPRDRLITLRDAIRERFNEPG